MQHGWCHNVSKFRHIILYIIINRQKQIDWQPYLPFKWCINIKNFKIRLFPLKLQFFNVISASFLAVWVIIWLKFIFVIFFKMLKGASLAPYWLFILMVCRCQIHRKPLWDLHCKVKPKIKVWLPDYLLCFRNQFLN